MKSLTIATITAAGPTLGAAGPAEASGAAETGGASGNGSAEKTL